MTKTTKNATAGAPAKETPAIERENVSIVSPNAATNKWEVGEGEEVPTTWCSYSANHLFCGGLKTEHQRACLIAEIAGGAMTAAMRAINMWADAGFPQRGAVHDNLEDAFESLNDAMDSVYLYGTEPRAGYHG